jgi:hypothetical protein
MLESRPSFIVEGEPEMRRNTRIIVAIACLALPVLACQALMGGGGNTPIGAPGSNIILSDDFSSRKWGTGTDSDSSIQYADNALQMIVYKKNWFVWSMPNDKSYQNVHVEVAVINNGADETTAFGIICDKQSGNDSFYYVGITPAGEYAIVKSTEGQSDVFLTGDNQWTASEAIRPKASSYHVGADCGNGTLTLYVDGQQIASVSDTTYTRGGVALFTWSGEEATKTDVSFDDFLMTRLP